MQNYGHLGGNHLSLNTERYFGKAEEEEQIFAPASSRAAIYSAASAEKTSPGATMGLPGG